MLPAAPRCCSAAFSSHTLHVTHEIKLLDIFRNLMAYVENSEYSFSHLSLSVSSKKQNEFHLPPHSAVFGSPSSQSCLALTAQRNRHF